MKNRLKLKLGDTILISVIGCTAILLFLLPLMSDKAESAEIVIAESGEVRTVALDKDAEYQITSRGVTLTVKVLDGEIFILHSSCRDSVCINTPSISRSGQSIVCAPAGVVVRITGEGAEVDAVTQ